MSTIAVSWRKSTAANTRPSLTHFDASHRKSIHGCERLTSTSRAKNKKTLSAAAKSKRRRSALSVSVWKKKSDAVNAVRRVNC